MFSVPGETYLGVVSRWGTYYTPNRERMWGWLIKYDVGDSFWMLEDDVLEYVVEDQSIQDDDTDNIGEESDRAGETVVVRPTSLMTPIPPATTVGYGEEDGGDDTDEDGESSGSWSEDVERDYHFEDGAVPLCFEDDIDEV